MKPEFSFGKELKDQKKVEQDPINQMLNKFEVDKEKDKRLANLILLKIPNSQSEAGQGMRSRQIGYAENEQYQIIGAYASHGWAVNKNMMNGGDKSCFLFNYHKNLRFNAVDGMDPYMNVETHTIDDREQRTIMFGDELQISREFKNVTSTIHSA